MTATQANMTQRWALLFKGGGRSQKHQDDGQLELL